MPSYTINKYTLGFTAEDDNWGFNLRPNTNQPCSLLFSHPSTGNYINKNFNIENSSRFWLTYLDKYYVSVDFNGLHYIPIQSGDYWYVSSVGNLYTTYKEDVGLSIYGIETLQVSGALNPILYKKSYTSGEVATIEYETNWNKQPHLSKYYSGSHKSLIENNVYGYIKFYFNQTGIVPKLGYPTPSSNFNIFGFHPTGYISQATFTILCSGEPYTFNFELNPVVESITNFYYEDGNGYRQLNPVYTQSSGNWFNYIFLERSGTSDYLYTQRVGGDLIFNNYDIINGLKFVRAAQLGRWKLVSYWKGTKDSIISYDEVLPNGVEMGSCSLLTHYPFELDVAQTLTHEYNFYWPNEGLYDGESIDRYTPIVPTGFYNYTRGRENFYLNLMRGNP